MARTKKRADPTDTSSPDDGWGTPIAGTPTLGNDKSMADVLRDDDRAKGQPGRGRTVLILLTSLLAQLVVIGAAGNPGVVGSANDYARDHTATLLGRFAELPAVFSWRIQQPSVDPGNLLVSEWFGLLALVVLSTIFTAVLVRGPVTFWRTGVAVWLAVVVATLANGMVRRGVVNDRGRFDDIGGKAGGVLFAGTGSEVIAGVIIGLVAALAAAIVAVVTRRPAELVLPATEDEPAPYAEPAAPPPWHGDSDRDGSVDQSSYATRSYAAPSYAAPYESAYGSTGAGRAADDSATTALPAQRAGDDWRDAEVTTQFAAASDAPTSGASAYERPATETAVPETSVPETSETSETPETPETPEPAPSASTPVPEPAAEQPVPAPDETAVLPAVPAESSTDTGNDTAAPHSDFPRPPDDEELGHHPSEDEADRPRT